MSDQLCPLCKSNSYLNPNIKILVSPCFHRLCEQCVYKLFAQGGAPCPTCQTPLRRINFITSAFEDLEVEREIRIRRLLHTAFTRKSEEFNSIEEYNDYLEEFENTVFDMLDAKSESFIKQQILRIKNESSILNPSTRPEKHRGVEDSPVLEKRQKVEDFKLSDLEGLRPMGPVITGNVIIPATIITPCEVAGLTRADALERIISSLFILT